jgi:hypothetical protein
VCLQRGSGTRRLGENTSVPTPRGGPRDVRLAVARDALLRGADPVVRASDLFADSPTPWRRFDEIPRGRPRWRSTPRGRRSRHLPISTSEGHRHRAGPSDHARGARIEDPGPALRCYPEERPSHVGNFERELTPIRRASSSSSHGYRSGGRSSRRYLSSLEEPLARLASSVQPTAQHWRVDSSDLWLYGSTAEQGRYHPPPGGGRDPATGPAVLPRCRPRPGAEAGDVPLIYNPGRRCRAATTVGPSIYRPAGVVDAWSPTIPVQP